MEGDGKEPRIAEPTNVRFGSKADMCTALGDVRFVPIADIPSFIRSLGRAGEQLRMNFRAKRLGRIEVDCFCVFLVKGGGL